MWIREVSFFLKDSRAILIDIRLGKQKASSQLVLGFLQAIEDFTKQFGSDKTHGVKQIVQGDYKLILEYGNWIGCAILAREDSAWLRGRMIYLISMFEDKYQDQIQSEIKDITVYQEFHGILLNILPHHILIQEEPYEPTRHPGIQQVPVFEGEVNGLTGREAVLLKLADGSRTLREISEIDNTPFVSLINEYTWLASKGVRIVKRIV